MRRNSYKRKLKKTGRTTAFATQNSRGEDLGSGKEAEKKQVSRLSKSRPSKKENKKLSTPKEGKKRGTAARKRCWGRRERKERTALSGALPVAANFRSQIPREGVEGCEKSELVDDKIEC